MFRPVEPARETARPEAVHLRTNAKLVLGENLTTLAAGSTLCGTREPLEGAPGASVSCACCARVWAILTRGGGPAAEA